MTDLKNLELVVKYSRAREYTAKTKEGLDAVTAHKDIRERLSKNSRSSGHSASRAWVEYDGYAAQTKIIVQVKPKRLAIDTEDNLFDVYIQFGERTFDYKDGCMRMNQVETVVDDFFDQYDNLHRKVQAEEAN